MANLLNTDKQIAIIGALAEAYAWSHETDDPATPTRHVAVLHITAVRAFIVQEFRNASATEA